MTEMHGRMSFIDLTTPNPARETDRALVFYGSGPGNWDQQNLEH
jgi:hypothetical protein